MKKKELKKPKKKKTQKGKVTIPWYCNDLQSPTGRRQWHWSMGLCLNTLYCLSPS